MDPLMIVYKREKRRVDLLRQKLRWPVVHGWNLPKSVDLRPWMTDIEDQGDMGSCVANAIVGNALKVYVLLDVLLTHIVLQVLLNIFIDVVPVAV